MNAAWRRVLALSRRAKREERNRKRGLPGIKWLIRYSAALHIYCKKIVYT